MYNVRDNVRDEWKLNKYICIKNALSTDVVKISTFS